MKANGTVLWKCLLMTQLLSTIQGETFPRLMYNCIHQNIKENHSYAKACWWQIQGECYVSSEQEQFRHSLPHTFTEEKELSRLQQCCTKEKRMARVFFTIPFHSAHKYTTFHLWSTSLSFLDAYKNDPKTKIEARMNWISGSIFSQLNCWPDPVLITMNLGTNSELYKIDPHILKPVFF